MEYAYINKLSREEKIRTFDKLLSSKIPCLVWSRSHKPDEDILTLARKYGVPILMSDKTTSDLMAEIIRWLKVELAPTISIHGVLVDVYGEGVLIMGESGIDVYKRQVWNFTGDIKQAAAGLFHDIATPVFAHTIDFMNDDHMKQESTESRTRAIIENSPEIRKLLQDCGAQVEDVDLSLIHI